MLPPLGKGHGWLPSNYVCSRAEIEAKQREAEAGDEAEPLLNQLESEPCSPGDEKEFSFTLNTAARVSEGLSSSSSSLNVSETEGEEAALGDTSVASVASAASVASVTSVASVGDQGGTFLVNEGAGVEYFHKMYNVYTLAGDSPANPPSGDEYWRTMSEVNTDSPCPPVDEISEAEISRLYTSVSKGPDDSLGELEAADRDADVVRVCAVAIS